MDDIHMYDFFSFFFFSDVAKSFESDSHPVELVRRRRESRSPSDLQGGLSHRNAVPHGPEHFHIVLHVTQRDHLAQTTTKKKKKSGIGFRPNKILIFYGQQDVNMRDEKYLSIATVEREGWGGCAKTCARFCLLLCIFYI